MFGRKKTSERTETAPHNDQGERVVDRDAATAEPPARTSDRDQLDDDRNAEHRAVPTEREQLEYRHEEFGGVKGGAIFYGWLISIGMTILLVGIVSAIATGVGSSLDVTRAKAELEADTIGLSAGIAIVAILMVGYFAGGYVAGRLARFDGARQGFGVWVLGLVITIVVVVVGAIFGDEYNVFQRIDLPSIPIPDETLSQGGIITLVAAVVGTLIAAWAGGQAGQRYHSRIDRATI